MQQNQREQAESLYPINKPVVQTGLGPSQSLAGAISSYAVSNLFGQFSISDHRFPHQEHNFQLVRMLVYWFLVRCNQIKSNDGHPQCTMVPWFRIWALYRTILESYVKQQQEE
jgi:hypothetical protein